jgi:hypothetical protein
MALNQFTTEFFETDITIVVLDTTNIFAEHFQTILESKNLQVSIFGAEPDLIATKTDLLSTAYKIILCLSPAAYPDSFEELLQSLQPFQEKLVVVMPIISGTQLQVPGEIPFFTEFLSSQRKVLSICNDILPQSAFIFGQDLIVQPGEGLLLDLFSQQIQKGFVFAPTVSFSPHTLPAFIEAATEQLFQAYRTSTVIRGRTKAALKIAQKISHQYEGYYFCDVALQPVDAVEVETIPFTVKEVVVSEEDDAVTAWYTKQLPSPEQPPFFNAAQLSFLGTHQETDIPNTQLPPANYPYQDVTLEEMPSLEPEVPDELLPAMPEEIGLRTQDIPQVALTPPENETAMPFSNTPIKIQKIDFNVSSEIQRIFAETRQEKKTERVTSLVKAQTRIKKKSKKRTTLFYGGLAFTGMGLGVLLLMTVFMMSFYLLKNSLLSVMAATTRNEPIAASQWSRLKGFTRLVAAQTTSYKAIVSLPQIEEAEHAVTVSRKLSELSQNLSVRDEDLKSLVLTVLGSHTGNIDELAENVGRESLTAHENLETIENELSQIEFSDSGSVDELVATYQKQVEDLKKQSFVQQQLQPILHPVFGQSQKRTYAVLFQNNQELRPTGGFIEAVALLTFDKGSLIDHSIYTSYEVHKKLPGEVTAPAELTKATGEKVYFFHDSNWNPDFPKAADQVKWFVEKGFNTKIDGVIAVDLYGIQNILESTGPLDLPEYNEVITSKNLLERMEFHSEVVLVESAKNQDYRKLLFSRLLEKVLALPAEKVASFLTALQTSFSQKDALIALSNQDEQQPFQSLGWSGAQIVPRCPSEFSGSSCLVDPFMQVEANVGVNKANYYLKRSIDHTISLSSTLAAHRRTINFENTAQLDAWPKGPYKNYMRFYLPATASKPTIMVGGAPLADAQITKTQENGQTVLGFMVEVPIQSKKQVVLEYSIPLTTTSEADFSYLFFNNKQPGTGETPFLLRILPAPSLRPQLIAPQASVAADGIVFTKPSDETSIYGIQFSQAN